MFFLTMSYTGNGRDILGKIWLKVLVIYRCNKHKYILSNKYDFERMLDINTLHENVCYFNNKRTIIRT